MKKILIVDDDQSINGMLCEKLREEGYDVTAAFGDRGTAAFGRCKTGSHSA